MTNHERSGLVQMLDEVPIGPAPLDALLASGRAARRRKQRTLIGGAAAVTALILGGGVIVAQAFDSAGTTRGASGEPASQPTAPSGDEVSAYEVLHQALRRSPLGETEIRAETAGEANRELGFDDDSGFRYLTYGNESWCVTDGVAVLAFVYWGDGAAQLYTDASPTATPRDCATVGYDEPIPANVRVAFRTDPETHHYRLEKGHDLVSQAMVDIIEGP